MAPPLSRRAFLAACAALALPRPAHGASRPAAGRFALTGTVFAGDPAAFLPGHAVVVEDDRIRAVLPAHQLPDDVPILASGGFVLPGVINCHVHRVHAPDDRRERYLRHGVTSIGDAASPTDALPLLARSPAGATATAAFAGPMLCPPGGYPLPVHSPDHALVVESPLHAREAVRRLADQGCTLLKLAFEPGPFSAQWPLPDPAVAAAAVDQARRLGMVARCHVEDLGGLAPALDAGVAVIDHVPHRHVTPAGSVPILSPDGDPLPEYARLLERMVRDGTIMVPTMDVFDRSLWRGPNLSAPVAAFHRLGGRIAVGNDFPYRGTDAGMPLAELHLLHAAGVEPEAVLRAATAGGARVCNLADRGAIAPGWRADLIVAPRDPREDLDVLAELTLIVKDGIIV